MPTISVIVPVYKVEKYIHRCVDSILAQTYTDFELILVDDGSPDSCGAICDEYAQKDSRVVVIHQENGGLSAARNAGIDWAFANSDSKWLTFIDSDDWIHAVYLEQLLNAAVSHGAPISICGYEETDGDMPQIQQNDLKAVLRETEVFYREHHVNAIVAWGKLYKKTCFENIRYPVGKIHEDEFVTYKILFEHEKIVVVSAPIYAYYRNLEGITKREWSQKRLDVLEAWEEQMVYFAKKGYPFFVKRSLRYYVDALLYGAESCKRLTLANKKVSQRIKMKARLLLIKYGKQMDFDKEKKVHIIWLAFPRIAKLYHSLKKTIRK